MSENDFVWQEAGSAYEALPDGAYMASFTKLEPVEIAVNGKPEPRWRWTWTVLSGTCAGRAATAATERELKPSKKGGRFVVGMLGRSPVAGDKMGTVIDGFVGKPFFITYGPGPKGGKPSVQTVSLPPAM